LPYWGETGGIQKISLDALARQQMELTAAASGGHTGDDRLSQLRTVRHALGVPVLVTRRRRPPRND